jgi:sRNA-binding protein
MGVDTTPAQPAGWYADATQRHDGRYWNGQGWTAVVSDENGNISEDLIAGTVAVDKAELKAIKQAAKDAARQANQAAKDAARQANQEARAREQFQRTPVGQARLAFERDDHVFQYAHDVMSQQAVIVSMVGSTTNKTTTDPSEILNAVCNEGWELVNGSFVFVEQGQQSRDKFMASGQNIAIKGTTVGYYLFRRCPENRKS